MRDRFFFAGVCCVSLCLLSAGVFMSGSVEINIEANDYYQYVELGKNIFRNGDFSVVHQTGERVSYPPLFSICIYLLTLFTGDPVISIRWLCALSISVSALLLYLLTKRLFNTGIAFLIFLFFAASVNLILSLYALSLHVFGMMPVVAVSWMTWRVISLRTARAFPAFACGFLLFLLSLTLPYGKSYLVLSLLAVFLFETSPPPGAPCRATHGRTRRASKKALLLLAGYLPFFALSLFPLSGPAQGRPTGSNTARTFLSGTYYPVFYRGYAKIFYKLDEEDNEFSVVKQARDMSLVRYALARPALMYVKYTSGVYRMADHFWRKCNPLAWRFPELFLNVIINNSFIILVLFAVFAPVFRRNVRYLLIWLIPLLFMPLVHVKMDYIVPFFPFCVALLVAGGYSLYAVFDRKKNVKIALLSVYLLLLAQLIYDDVSIHGLIPSIREYEKTAQWVKENARPRGRRLKIMARKTVFSYLADTDFLALPYEKEWGRIWSFARSKGVDYIIVDKRFYYSIPHRIEGIDETRKVYHDTSNNNEISVYEVE